MNYKKARLDTDRTAKPLSRILVGGQEGPYYIHQFLVEEAQYYTYQNEEESIPLIEKVK